MLLLQKDDSHSQRNFVRKKGCHPHKNSVFLKAQLFLRGKANCRSIIIWNVRFIRNNQGQSRFKTHGAHRELYWWYPYWHRCTWQELTLHCSTGCVLMALRLNLQPQETMWFRKPEENNRNSVISYQSRLFLQPANHKSVPLDYKEVRWMSGYHFVQTCMKDNGAKNPAVLGGH